jgi:hypothetical protein
MKYFKLFICVFCLAILMTACGGTKMSLPEKVPNVKIESIDRAIHS